MGFPQISHAITYQYREASERSDFNKIAENCGSFFIIGYRLKHCRILQLLPILLTELRMAITVMS
jgi:hypothetical protein